MTFQLSDLQHLIRQLGPSLPEISSIVEEDSDSWQISFDAGPSIQLSWQENSARALLCCAIGKPNGAHRESVFEKLLTMNVLLQGEFNLKLGLSSPEDDVILMGELDSGTKSLEMLQAEIADYLRFAARFSQLVNQPVIESDMEDLTHAINFELQKA